MKGQVRGSNSARLGEVRDGSRDAAEQAKFAEATPRRSRHRRLPADRWRPPVARPRSAHLAAVVGIVHHEDMSHLFRDELTAFDVRIDGWGICGRWFGVVVGLRRDSGEA